MINIKIIKEPLERTCFLNIIKTCFLTFFFSLALIYLKCFDDKIKVYNIYILYSVYSVFRCYLMPSFHLLRSFQSFSFKFLVLIIFLIPFFQFFFDLPLFLLFLCDSLSSLILSMYMSISHQLFPFHIHDRSFHVHYSFYFVISHSV